MWNAGVGRKKRRVKGFACVYTVESAGFRGGVEYLLSSGRMYSDVVDRFVDGWSGRNVRCGRKHSEDSFRIRFR